MFVPVLCVVRCLVKSMKNESRFFTFEFERIRMLVVNRGRYRGHGTIARKLGPGLLEFGIRNGTDYDVINSTCSIQFVNFNKEMQRSVFHSHSQPALSHREQRTLRNDRP